MLARKVETHRKYTFLRSLRILTLMSAILMLAVTESSFAQSAKTRIESVDDLPVHSYPLSGSAINVMSIPTEMAKLITAMRQDLIDDLASYDITDAATLQSMYGSLARLDQIEANYISALTFLDKVQELEEKQTSKLTKDLVARALIAARTDATAVEFEQAFRTELQTRLVSLPWELVQDKVKDAKARAEYMSENLLMGVVESQIQPAVTATGELSSELADALIKIYYTIDVLLPINSIVADVYSEYIAINTVEKTNIWPTREVVLDSNGTYSPVVVAIWDAGVDVGVFKDQLFVNQNETMNGLDDDGNGFVDDLYGIAFDLEGWVTSQLLLPLGSYTENIDGVFDFMQGFWDMTSAIDSPAATSTQQKLASLAPSEVGSFLDTLSFYNHYMHGTHVAGIAVDGNPFARILVSRLTFDHRQIPQAMTPEIARRWADGFAASAAYFKDNGVRVVNMSWGVSFKEVEASLEANGVGSTTDERTEMAREFIDILADGLRKTINSTPEILYVTAAGNDDNDVQFDVIIPSSFKLPNLLVVGALDQSGDPTSFTSGGANVKLYANGYRVESFVPGGRKIKGSGTSMAAPGVSNLAAKLFAYDPMMTVQQVITLIEESADAHPNHPNILRINPLETFARLNR